MERRKLIFIIKSATMHNLLVLATLLAIMSIFIMPDAKRDLKSHAKDIALSDGFFVGDPQSVYEMMEAIGANGRKLYLVIEGTADLVHFVIMGFFFAVLLIWSGLKLKPAERHLKVWILFPSLLMLSNIIENLFIAAIILLFPARYYALAITASVLTSLKWVLISICIILILRNLIILSKKSLHFFTLFKISLKQEGSKKHEL